MHRYYPRGLRRYDQIVPDEHRVRWKAGDWTDDTDQMLCILDSLLAKRQVDIHDIAARLMSWVVNGGMGIGMTVLATLQDSEFLQQPHAAAQRIWEESGRQSAANGGVMRTSILGVWEYQSPKRVRHNAEQVCKVTHYDPRPTLYRVVCRREPGYQRVALRRG